MSGSFEGLGPLEMEIVGLMEGEKPISVATVREKLQRNGRDLAYTTVMTVLMRLYRKKVLARTREGRQYLYSCAKGVGSLKGGLLERMRRSLFGRERLEPILALLEEDKELTTEELRELRDVVVQKLKGRERR